jgi:catechol 2,3-dioxygenase
MSNSTLPAGSRVSQVVLTVSDLDQARSFYEGTLGLAILEDGHDLQLGARGDPFLRLVHDPQASVARGTARLYHFAILYPSRGALADATRRLVERRWPLQGAADHLVSEAVYLPDPEGNGIEIYRDRPRAEWARSKDGIQMATLPLDQQALLSESKNAAAPVPDGTVMGHIHLHVRDIAESERFYQDVVGLELMARYGDSASFLAAGGYHHHLGINTWGTAGARPAVAGALGLRWYRLELPDAEAVAALASRLESGSVPYQQDGDTLQFADPSGHRLLAGVS